MKHIKQFEEVSDTMKKGDLVMVYNLSDKWKNDWKLLSDFLLYNVGIMTDSASQTYYNVYYEYYEDIPDEILTHFTKRGNNLYEISVAKNKLRLANSDEIKKYKMKQDAKKYNI